MKRFSFLLSVLCVWFCASPVRAQDSGDALRQRLQQSLLQHQSANAALGLEILDPYRFYTEAVEQTAFSTPKYVMQELSWKIFLQKNKETSEVKAVDARVAARYDERIIHHLQNVKYIDSVSFSHSFDYSHWLPEGIKLIYVSEAISHDTRKAPQEVIRMMHQLRRARPRARILLATEFLVWNGEKGVSLLHRAKQPQNNLYSHYQNVTQAADRLNIDQLALEDSIITTDENKHMFVKVNTYWVQLPHTEQELQQIQQNNWQLHQGQRKRYRSDFSEMLSISDWGVRERNRQWARRIKAAAGAYDLVIVYGGSGHLDESYAFDVPTLVKEKHVFVSLNPMENLPQGITAYYEQRQEDAATARFNTSPAQATPQLSQKELQSVAQKVQQSLHQQKPVYLQVDEDKIPVCEELDTLGKQCFPWAAQETVEVFLP